MKENVNMETDGKRETLKGKIERNWSKNGYEF